MRKNQRLSTATYIRNICAKKTTFDCMNDTSHAASIPSELRKHAECKTKPTTAKIAKNGSNMI